MPHMVHPLRVFAIVFALLWVSTDAFAQSTPKDGVEQTEFDRALKLALSEFDLGHWAEARSHFERAHELQPSARTLRAIAACAFEQRLYVDSIVYGQQALVDPRKPLDGKLRKQAEQILERAYGFVAQLDVVLTPEDAQVTVDLKAPTIVAGKLLLDPGEHEIHVSARGFEDSDHRFVAQPRESRTITIKLKPVGAAPVAQSGPDPATASNSSPEPDSGLRVRRKVALGVGGVGILTLGASLTFALLAKSNHDDAACTSAGCEDAKAKRLNDRAITFANVSTGTAIAGGAALGAAIAMYLWPARWTSQGEVALSVSPALASNVSGASLEVVW